MFEESLKELENEKQRLDLWENIQSTNWQSLRFKPPTNSDSGWRVEFRTCELQTTDFENAAFVTFLTLLTRTILSFNLNLLIPISRIDANMHRAQKRDACLQEKFYFRLNIFDKSTSSDCVQEMSINEILNGNKENSFPGLIHLIEIYLTNLENIDFKARLKIKNYLELIGNIANGRMQTTASRMREFVLKHSKYKFDSVVSDEIAYDLMWHLCNSTYNF